MQRTRQRFARNAAGSAWQDRDGLVFTDAVGRALRPEAVSRTFTKARECAGIPRVRFHDLRHSAATTLLAAGVPLAIAITASSYAAIVCRSSTTKRPPRWTARLAMAKRIRARWADGPNGAPAPGEAVGRSRRPRVRRSASAVPGGGRAAPRVTLDGDRLTPTGPVEPTDLVYTRRRLQLVLEAEDGRRLVARFGTDVDAPQIDADAPADLRDAMNRLWRAQKKPGPIPGDGLTIGRIRRELRASDGPCPPPQDQVTEYKARRIREVLNQADTSWDREVSNAAPDRGMPA